MVIISGGRGKRVNVLRVALLRYSAARTAPTDSVRRDRFGGMLGVGYGDVFQRADMLRLREWSHCPVTTAYGQKRPASSPTEGGGGVGGWTDEGWKAGGAARRTTMTPRFSRFPTAVSCRCGRQ